MKNYAKRYAKEMNKLNKCADKYLKKMTETVSKLNKALDVQLAILKISAR